MLLWLRNLRFKGGLQSVFPPGVVKWLFDVPEGNHTFLVPAGIVDFVVPEGTHTFLVPGGSSR